MCKHLKSTRRPRTHRVDPAGNSAECADKENSLVQSPIHKLHRITVAWFASDLGMEGTQRSTSSVFVIGGSSQGVDIQIQSEPLYSELPLPACYKTTSKVKSTHPCRVVIPIVMLLSRKRSNSDISSENARPANHCEGTLICRRLTAFQKFHALICWGVQARLPLYPKGLWGHQSSSRDRVLF